MVRFRETLTAVALVLAVVPAYAQTPPLPPAASQQQAQASVNPPGRVGAIAYALGTVSFHDDQQDGWSPAVVNYPVGTGDALWTEPDGRVELVVGGTRLRLQGASELDALAIDDTVTRYQLARGRVDLRVTGMVANQPVEIVTPRGTVALLQNGDYVVEAGTTDDPTRIGVRTGSARVTAPNGSALAVPAGQTGLLTGTADAPTFQVVQQAPPALPQEWAERDRIYVAATASAAQYTAPGVTGVEDLDQYGTWSNVGTYGRVWSPRNVAADWQPYRDGHWAWVQPWGWTWVDDQPWGFAPSHYGRWVHNDRWYWVPPVRTTRAIYAPAVVGFVDGGSFNPVAAGIAAAATVAWFALGPDDVYLPYYSRDRAYIRELNRSNIRDQRVIDQRFDYFERRDANRGDYDPRFTPTNRRFATVVKQEDFVRSREVRSVAIRVSPDDLAKARAVGIAAPPAGRDRATDQPGRPGQPQAQPRDQAGRPPQGATLARSAIGDVPVIGRPSERERATAPGPTIKRPTAEPQQGGRTPDRDRNARPELPQHSDRAAVVPPGPQRAPGRTEPDRPGQPGTAAVPPATQPQPPLATPPGTPPRPEDAARPGRDGDNRPPKAAEPGRTGQERATPPERPAGQPPVTGGRTPPVPEREREAAPGRPGQPPAAPQAQQPPHPPATPQAQQPPQRPATPQAQEPPKTPAAPQAQEPPKVPPATQARPQVPERPPQQATPPAPQRAEPPAQRERDAQPAPRAEPPAQRERQAQPAPRAEPPAQRAQPEPRREERPPQVAQPPKAEPPARAAEPPRAPEPKAEPQRSEPQREDRERK